MNEEKDKKPVALVTGGGRGIGRAVCRELAKSGYTVLVNYRSNNQAADETVNLITEAGGTAEAFRFDVADHDETDTALKFIFSRNESIDVLVNNAGTFADGLFVMMPKEDWTKVIDTTLKGFYNVTKPVLQKMIPMKRGSVVSISSLSGLIGNRGQANYSAAKAGLIGASRSLSKEVARLGIRVNVVAPGLIDTEMIEGVQFGDIKKLIPMARIGKPDEVARVVRFLCSDDASYITGEVISVNGGMF